MKYMACNSNTQGFSDVHGNYVLVATEVPPAKPEASNAYDTGTPDARSHEGSPSPQPERRYSNISEDSEQALDMSLNSLAAFQSLVR